MWHIFSGPDLIQFLKSKRRKPNESDSMSDNNQIKISSPNASHAHAVYSSNEANKHYSVPSTFSTQHLEGNSFPSVSVADIQESGRIIFIDNGRPTHKISGLQ